MDGWTGWAAGESRVFWVCRYLMLVVSLGMLLPPSLYLCVLCFVFLFLFARHPLAWEVDSRSILCMLAEKRVSIPFTRLYCCCCCCRCCYQCTFSLIRISILPGSTFERVEHSKLLVSGHDA
jgi:hypothetical protein